MADNSSYDADYIKLVGFQVWRLLSKALGVKVTKCNLHSVLREKAHQISGLAALAPRELKDIIAIKRQDWGEAIDVSVFCDVL